MSELDLMLYRPVKNAGRFAGLFPESTCESTYLGKGMTDFSIKNMVDWVNQYAWQTAKVAPLLKGNSLSDTCTRVHNFLYNYFQYKADTDDQILRSPACSWHVRYDGIDCKSYSILASCLLSNLGITHYIRRVKQPGFHPDLWTHVYVIVPEKPQDAALQQGYYVVDGTVRDDYETPFVQKDDTIMSMNHYGMNAARGLNAGETTTGTTSTSSGASSGSSISKILSGINLKFLGSLSCIGGTLDKTDTNQALPEIVTWFDKKYQKINELIANNQSGLIDEINVLYATSYKMASHAKYYAAYDWGSSCSANATKAYKAVADYYVNVLTKVFQPWIEQYFTVSYKTVATQNTPFPIVTSIKKGSENKGFFQGSFSRATEMVQLTSLVLKSGPQQIMKFEFTAYVSGGANYDNNKFNTVQALQGFTTLLASFGVNKETTTTTSTTSNGTTVTTTTNGGGGSTTPLTTKDSGVTPTTPEDTPKTSTTTIVVGIAAAAAIGYVLFGKKKTGLTGPRRARKITNTRRK